MFNYIRNDQIIKKPINSKPMTPIELEVNMPIGMQPVPQTDPNVTCFYPEAASPPPSPSIPSMPNMTPQPLPQPMPKPMPCPYCNMPPQVMMPPMSGYMCPYHPSPTPSPTCDQSKNQDDMEIAYLNKMYPPLCRKIQKYITAELNQYDHDLSPIYEMYPSTETIDYLANCIYTNIKGDMANLIKEFEGNPSTRAPMGGSFYTLVYALLLNELYRKRMRRRLYRS